MYVFGNLGTTACQIDVVKDEEKDIGVGPVSINFLTFPLLNTLWEVL